MIDHADDCGVVRAGLCDCGAKLEKLEAKLAKVRAAKPQTGLEMAARDIRIANLEHEIFQLEQLQDDEL